MSKFLGSFKLIHDVFANNLNALSQSILGDLVGLHSIFFTHYAKFRKKVVRFFNALFKHFLIFSFSREQK